MITQQEPFETPTQQHAMKKCGGDNKNKKANQKKQKTVRRTLLLHHVPQCSSSLPFLKIVLVLL